MSGLIRIQTTCHSDGIPERVFVKVNFEEKKNQKTTNRNIARGQKYFNNTLALQVE